MGKSRDIVERFFGAMHSGDGAAARQQLKDNLTFSGPFDRFDNADSYIKSLAALGSIVKGADMHHLFEDGDDVAVFYDLVTDSPAGAAPIAEWHHVEGDKIARIQVIFDARPFAAMMGR